ncbi:MAG: tetratricopeptide repeat protein [Acidobacteriota bacterium]
MSPVASIGRLRAGMGRGRLPNGRHPGFPGRRWRSALSGRAWVLLTGLLILVAGVGSVEANPLFDAWGEVQNSLATDQEIKLEVGLQRLLMAKKELGLNRVTPFAEALAAASLDRPGPVGSMMLESAKRLDPLLPAPRFIMGRRAWASGNRVKALGEFANGAVNMMRLPSVRQAVISSCIPWALMTLGLSVVAAIVIQVVVFFRLISVDAYILGLRLFSRINALIFASVVVSLPLFAGLGPVWVLSYLFALVWIYMALLQRIAAGVSLCVIVVTVPLLGLWHQACLVPTPLQERIVEVLSERKADFVTLREFIELESEFEGTAAYHVVAGELLRLHGDRELGRLEFEKATLVSPNSVLPRLFLGVYALEDRDPWRALELLNEVVEMDPNRALGHYNLAIALDLTRRFDEGDAERRRARELAKGPLENLGFPGQEDRVLLPRLGSGMVEGLADQASAGAKFALDNRVRGTDLLNGLTVPPLSLAALVGLVVGGGMLAVRKRWYGPAQECGKCGKVFRPDDKSVYCEQCVSVFLKRNAVSIEQQTAKVAQVRRWELISGLVTRSIGVAVPGGRQIVYGRVVSGILLTFIVWLPLLGAVAWVPLFLRTIEPALPVLGLQVVLVLAGVGGWVIAALAAWNRR